MSNDKQRHLDESQLALWEREALLSLEARASQVEFLAAPDWKSLHAVHLRHRETSQVFAMIRTDHPEYLRMVVALPKDFDARAARKSLGLPLRKTTSEATHSRYELRVVKQDDVTSAAFEQFFATLVDCFPRFLTPAKSMVAPADFAKLASRGKAKDVTSALAVDAQLAREPRAINGAAAKGHEKVVRLLLSNGADPNASAPLSRNIQNADGTLRKLPLHQAAGELRQNAVSDAKRRAGHLQSARLLIDAGADLEARATRQEVTPLLSAAMGGSREMVDLLIEYGAQQSFFALSALGDVSEVRSQLEKSPKLAQQTDTNDMTALMYCAASRLGIRDPQVAAALAKTAELLISHGAPVDAVRENYWAGEPPHQLNAASFAALGNPAVLRVLLKHNACLEIGGTSFTAIGQAVMSRSEEALCLLLAHQLQQSIDDPKFAGWTSTHWMAASAEIVDDIRDMILWICKKGLLKPTAEDAHGQTPVDVARSRGFDEVAGLLQALS